MRTFLFGLLGCLLLFGIIYLIGGYFNGYENIIETIFLGVGILCIVFGLILTVFMVGVYIREKINL